MKPFNLEEAKAGKPVCTRDGRKARIICFDRNHSHYHIVALVQGEKGNEMIVQCSSDGEYHGNNKDNSLVMESVKREGWVNIHQDYSVSGIYNSKTQAEIFRSQNTIDTIKIEWEE